MHINWVLVQQIPEKLKNVKPQIITLDETLALYHVGRARENEVNILSTYVSRHHCQILKKRNKLFLVDNGSSNGTFVNGIKILPKREIPLEVGDLIGVGVTEYVDANCYIYKLLQECVEEHEENIIILSDSDNETKESGDDKKYLLEAKEVKIKSDVDCDSISVNVETKTQQNSLKRHITDACLLASKIPRLSQYEGTKLPESNIQESSKNMYESKASVIKDPHNNGSQCSIKESHISDTPKIKIESEVLNSSLLSDNSKSKIDCDLENKQLTPTDHNVTLSLRGNVKWETEERSKSDPCSFGCMKMDVVSELHLNKKELTDAIEKCENSSPKQEFVPQLTEKCATVQAPEIISLPKMKELIVKVERLNETDSQLLHNNSCNNKDNTILDYTLEDDIIVISDDDEMFPSSQLFSEIKQEPQEENDVEGRVTYNNETDQENSNNNDLIETGVSELIDTVVVVDDDDDDDDSGDSWLAKLSQSYFEAEKDPIHIKKNNSFLSEDQICKSDLLASEQSYSSEAIPSEGDIVDSSKVDNENSEKVGPEARCDTIFLNDIQEPKESDIDKQNKGGVPSTSKGIFSSKPIIIEPPHLGRRRRTEGTILTKKAHSNKALQCLLSGRQSDSRSEKKKSVRKKRHSSSFATSLISTVEKKTLNEVRKKRLKAITENTKKEVESKDEVKRNATLRVKVTEKNRGAFLTEGITSVDMQLDVNRSCIEKEFTMKEKLTTNSNCDVISDSISDSKTSKSKKTCENLPQKQSISPAENNGSASTKKALPKIPRKKTTGPADETFEHISPLCTSPNKSINTYGKYVPSMKNKMTVCNSYSEKRNLPTGSQKSAASSTNLQHNTLSDKIHLKQPIKSCLVPVSQVKESKIIKKVSFSHNLTQVRTYQIPENSRLIPVGTIKDAPIPKASVKMKLQNVSEIERSLNEVISLICQWNPKWLEEQKSNNSPPPLTTMKLYPMLTFFKSYEDYRNILLPLMLHNIWNILYNNVEERQCNPRSDTHVFVLEEVSSPDNGLMSVSCSAVLPQQELSLNSHPKIGDLLLTEIQIVASNSPTDITASQDFREGRFFAKAFAYVESTTIGRLSSDCFNNTFRTSYQAQQRFQQMKITLKLLVKARPYKVSTKMRTKVLTYLRADLRQFQALSVLPTSQLCQHILCPNLEDYNLPAAEGQKLWTEEPLNEKQKEIVLKCSEVCDKKEPKICLIQGPPGTGKSTVIKNLVTQILYGKNTYRKNWHQKRNEHPRILLCAPSNAAIDEVVDRLLVIRQSLPKEMRFKMVRVGKAIRPSVHSISLEELAKKEVKNSVENLHGDPESLQLEFRCLDARLESYQMMYKSQTLNEVSREAIQAKIASIQAKRKQFELSSKQGSSSRAQQLAEERRAQIDLLRGADIIATTLNSCYNNQMESVFGINAKDRVQITCCIVDEATQCSEPDSLIPLLLGINCIVLVGDPEQLPATVISNVAKEHGFGQSLFARIRSCFETQESSAVQLLNIQYRMHPEICLWPNQYFYMSKLENGPGLIERRNSTFFPYIILSLNYEQESYSDMRNCSEASFVITLAKQIVNFTAKRMRIGIITPYKQQCKELSAHLLKCPSDVIDVVDINTIDSSQGQERDIVIISCTRTEGVGFMTNTERLNVAITRARYNLIICGNFMSLKNDSMWRSLIANAMERGCFKRVQSSMTENEVLQLILKKQA